MKKILVVTDFSNASKNALIYAKELAIINESIIIVYNPHKPLIILDKFNINELVQPTDINAGDVKLLLEENELVKEILLIQKNENVDLLIMGINGVEFEPESTFKKIISNLMKVTAIPLIIIPEKMCYQKIEKIAFAVDFILDNELEMHKSIKEFLLCINPKIFVLNVVKENAEIMNDRKISEYNVEKYFENESHIYSFIENNDLINGLKDFISSNKIDIMAMLPHKHSFLQNILTESKTKKMAFNTNIPLVIFPMGN